MPVTPVCGVVRYTMGEMGARFQIPPDASLRVVSISGTISIIAEERSDLEIDPPARHVKLHDGGRAVEIKSGSGALRVRCPRGIDVCVGAVSGSVHLEGAFGNVKVSAISGHVEVDSAAGDVDVRSVSGHLSVNTCGGRCQLNTKSGSIRVGHAEGAIRASTLSGRVELGTAGRDEVEIRTISGGISIHVPPGRAPRVRLRSISGRLRCDCQQGADFEIKAATVSGSVEIAET